MKTCQVCGKERRPDRSRIPASVSSEKDGRPVRSVGKKEDLTGLEYRQAFRWKKMEGLSGLLGKKEDLTDLECLQVFHWRQI